MKFSGPALPSRLVTDRPYFFAIVVEVEMPSREAKPSSSLTLAGPGTPTRIGRSTPASRTSAIHCSTRSTSKSTCVMIAPGRLSWVRAAAFFCSAGMSTAAGMFGSPDGWPPIEMCLTPYCCRMPDSITARDSSYGPIGTVGSPPMISTLAAAPMSRSADRYSSSMSCDLIRRAEMCGTGVKPRRLTAAAAVIRMARSSFSRNVTLIRVPGGMTPAAFSTFATSLPVISMEKSSSTVLT